jgi:hypothetical protein
MGCVGRAPDALGLSGGDEAGVTCVLELLRIRQPDKTMASIQTQHNQRDPRCPSRNLLLPRFSLLPLGDTIENEYEKTNSLSRCDIRLTSSCHLWRNR